MTTECWINRKSTNEFGLLNIVFIAVYMNIQLFSPSVAFQVLVIDTFSQFAIADMDEMMNFDAEIKLNYLVNCWMQMIISHHIHSQTGRYRGQVSG